MGTYHRKGIWHQRINLTHNGTEDQFKRGKKLIYFKKKMISIFFFMIEFLKKSIKKN